MEKNGMRKGKKYVFMDYKTIGRKLTMPYRVGFNLCMLLCVSCFFITVAISQSKESVYFLLFGIFFGFIGMVLKSKLNEIEYKIESMGVENAWEYFKGKNIKDSMKN